jgi:hypothetical protein
VKMLNNTQLNGVDASCRSCFAGIAGQSFIVAPKKGARAGGTRRRIGDAL